MCFRRFKGGWVEEKKEDLCTEKHSGLGQRCLISPSAVVGVSVPQWP